MTTLDGSNPDGIRELITQIGEGTTILDLATEGKDKKITVTRKKPEPQVPVRSESNPRAHVFHSVNSLIEYIKTFTTPMAIVSDASDNVVLESGEEVDNSEAEEAIDRARGGALGHGVVIFVEPNGISAVLDERAEKGREVVRLEPATHPYWEVWGKNMRGYLTLEAFLDLVRIHRKSIISPDPRGLVHDLRQVRSSREVTAIQGTGRESTNGFLVKIKIRGQGEEGQETPIELPETIQLRLPIFVDEDPIDVELDLLFDVLPDEGLVVRLASADVEVAVLAALEDGVKRMRDQLPGAVVAWGRWNEWEWGYLNTSE